MYVPCVMLLNSSLNWGFFWASEIERKPTSTASWIQTLCLGSLGGSSARLVNLVSMTVATPVAVWEEGWMGGLEHFGAFQCCSASGALESICLLEHNVTVCFMLSYLYLDLAPEL